MGALPEIVEQQRGKNDGEPAEPDRPRAEMAEIGIHRLAAGDDQHQRAEDQQRLAQRRPAQERDAESGIEGGQDRRLARDLGRAERRR